MARDYHVPVIDLDQISNEEELLPVVKKILYGNDTFLLKNYANRAIVDDLLDNLVKREAPDLDQGFDANFTGTLRLSDDVTLEQYIFNTDQTLRFDRKCGNASLHQLYTRLFKVALFFSQLCLKSIGNDLSLNEAAYSTVISRYHYRDSTTQILPNGETFEYMLDKDYRDFLPTGILTVFPTGKGVKFKPPTVSSTDNTWVSIDEPDCLLFHTGTLLAKLSGGTHSTSAVMVSPEHNVVHLTIAPPLSTVIDGSGKKLADILLVQQIQELPDVAQKLYPRETCLIRVEKLISFYKELFFTCETVLSLFAMSRSTNSAPRLHSILPQITNMMQRKIVEEDFLKMVSLWPECYYLEADSKGELTVGLPKVDKVRMLVNKSRRLAYVERADRWFKMATEGKDVPADVPVWKMSKRRGSDGSNFETNSSRPRPSTNNSPKKSNYIFNAKERFMYIEKKKDSQSNLLERLRERERRSAALLSQRQRQYDQFLAVKMRQVFEILHSLPPNKPYTITNLGTLIVDSLQDSNNPIGFDEAEMILDKLQCLLSDELSVQTVDGGLKVFRWNELNKENVASKIDRELNRSQESI